MASTTVNINLVSGVDPADADAAVEVTVGEHVKWIYCEVNFSADVITNAKTIQWCIRKLPFGTVAQIPSLYNQVDKRFIIKRGMEMLPRDLSTVYKRVFVVRVPKSMQRIGQSDKIVFQYVCSSSENVNVCGFFIYRSLK